MEFQRRTDREFLNAFLGIMSSRKNNTYKFALARFLLEYSQDHDDLQVRYSKIAQYFMKCYWMQECKYKLRQGPAKQTPEVISIIRKEFDRSYYPQTDLDQDKAKGAAEDTEMHRADHRKVLR